MPNQKTIFLHRVRKLADDKGIVLFLMNVHLAFVKLMEVYTKNTVLRLI